MERENNIHAAIEQGDVDHLRVLVADGVDVEQLDGYATPLLKAVLRDNLEMVDLLFAAGANVNSACTMDHMNSNPSPMKNALSIAIFHLFILSNVALTPVRHKIIKRLIATGADLDVVDQLQHMYYSPLQTACMVKLWPVVVDLIEAGSKVDVKGPHDMMPLATATALTYRFEEDCLRKWASQRKALNLLLEKSPTLRMKAEGSCSFRRHNYIISWSTVYVPEDRQTGIWYR